MAEQQVRDLELHGHEQDEEEEEFENPEFVEVYYITKKSFF